VQAAFCCVYDALDHMLPTSYQAKICFNAIFIEHLLCKVSCWKKMFPKKVYNTL
ncbi:hypothetical protein BDP27DRAFT_1224112, partial [Rhodocollybia butyracea]